MNASRPLTATLTEGSVAKHLFWMSLPMVIGLVANMSFNAVDTYFVAKLGPNQLAAMSFTFPVVMMIVSIGIGLGAGTSSAVARALGAGDDQQVRRLVTDSAALALLLSVVLTVVGLLTIDPLFTLLGATPELLPLIRDYMEVWYCSVGLLVVPMVATSTIRALGNSRLAGQLMIAIALLNLILDPLLIFGLWGFPRLELQGAALATLIARLVAFLITGWYLIVKVPLLVSPFAGKAEIFASWKRLLQVGLPAMATNVIIPVASGVVVAMIASYGTNAVAGFGVAMRVEPLALIPFYALSSVIGPFCGQNFGAGKIERVKESLKVITVFSLLFGLLLAVCLWLLAGSLAGLFSSEPSVLSVAVSYLAIVPISYGAYGLVMSINASFNGLGQPLPAVVISAARVAVIYLPIAWLASQWLQVTGIFIATAVINIGVGIVGYFWLQRTLITTHQNSLQASLGRP